MSALKLELTFCPRYNDDNFFRDLTADTVIQRVLIPTTANDRSAPGFISYADTLEWLRWMQQRPPITDNFEERAIAMSDEPAPRASC